MNNKSIKRYAMKQLDMGSMLKGITSVRKSLIDANRQAMLAVDELEDYAYTNDSAVASIDSDAIENVIKYVRSISGGLQKLVTISDEAKQAIRECMDSPDREAVSEAPAPQKQQVPARRYRSSRRRRR